MLGIPTRRAKSAVAVPYSFLLLALSLATGLHLISQHEELSGPPVPIDLMSAGNRVAASAPNERPEEEEEEEWLDQDYTHSWLERVLGPDRKGWEALAAPVTVPPPLSSCDEASLGTTGVLNGEGGEDEEDERGLTQAACRTSYGFSGHCYQTCRFHNLYAPPGGGALEAHVLDESKTFPFKRVAKIRLIVRGVAMVDHSHHRVTVRRHASLESFERNFAGIGMDEYKGMAVAMVPLYHANIGHALYDYLYPAYLELLYLGLGTEDFRVVTHYPKGWREYDDDLANVQAQKRHEDLFGIFGGAGVTRREGDVARALRLQDVIVGIGSTIDEADMNVNFTLAGGVGPLDAVRKFRDRMMRKFNVKVPPREPDGLVRAILIDNPGRLHTWWAKEAVKEARRHGVKLTRIFWPEYGRKDSEGNGNTPKVFAKHLKVLAKADVHLSGPGTSMMYQQFLRDGCVHVNLGNSPNDENFHTARYMDEFMAEGAPHLRALYALLSEKDDNHGRTVGRLAGLAAKIVREGFSVPVPRGMNLSPTTTVIKAYAHLQYGRRLNSLNPLIHLPGEEHGLGRIDFGTFHWIARVDRARHDRGSLKVANPCLLEALGRNYDQRYPGKLKWFEQRENWTDDDTCFLAKSLRPYEDDDSEDGDSEDDDSEDDDSENDDDADDTEGDNVNDD